MGRVDGWMDGIGYLRSYVGLLRASSVLIRAIFLNFGK